MSLELKKRALRILDDILERTPQDRQEFLSEACGDDMGLRHEVESLLDTDADAGILSKPAFSVHAEDASIGRTIDSYKLVRLLDRGGMGTVYLAEREDFEKRVALKLIRRGLDLDEVLVRRFHNERQILARLDHPNIARLMDGGTTADRLPYFVMEYVEGEPIDRYCEARGLSVDERLELFRKVCSAVHFAHQNLVIHRDLKPGNVLITADGTPKLLDFGIAKLLDEGLAALSVETETGLAPMTPRYASPEQIRLEPLTTASDVYALGVMLYELLTGLDPYNVDHSRRIEIARAICEQDPDKPSTAVRRRAAERTTSPRHLRRRLSGDLDSIVLKAMRKEPQERYSSAEELSDDIRRHLAGLPVAARAGTFTYYAGKFVRRNKLKLAVAAVFFLLIFVAVRSRELEKRERQGADEAYQLVEDLFRSASPDASTKKLTIREWLKKAKARILQLEPRRRIGVAGALGEVFRSLGAFDESKELMETALQSARELYGKEHPEVAKRMSNLSVLLYDHQEYTEAERLFRDALGMMERLGEDEANILRFKGNVATVLLLQDEFDKAEELYLDVLETRIKLWGRDDPDVATSRRNLGALYYARGDDEKAEVELREALRIRRQKYGSQDTKVASVLSLLGNVLADRGEEDEAERVYDEAVDIWKGKSPRDHPSFATIKANLAALWVGQAPETAQVLLAQALEAFAERKYEGWEVAEAEGVEGMVLAVQGCYQEAELWLVESYEKLKEDRGERNFHTRKAIDRLVDFYDAWGRPDKRDEYLAKASKAGTQAPHPNPLPVDGLTTIQ